MFKTSKINSNNILIYKYSEKAFKCNKSGLGPPLLRRIINLQEIVYMKNEMSKSLIKNRYYETLFSTPFM